MAARLLDFETQGTDDDEAAAGRVFERAFALLSPVLGAEGTRSLLARSAQLAAARFPALDDLDLATDGSISPAQALVARLRHAPETSRETAIAVCATLLSLLETLIGERLTSQLLKAAWPAFEAPDQETP
jgi:hypothetical protein